MWALDLKENVQKEGLLRMQTRYLKMTREYWQPMKKRNPLETLYSIENSKENRMKFKGILFTTKGINDFIGGIILNEETFDQKDSSGKLLVEHLKVKNIEIGIKMDKG